MEMLIHAKLRKPDRMSNQEFFGVWKQEATAALEAVKAGVIKQIWKVPGKYEVFLVMEVDSVDRMDEIMHGLPIWKLGYEYIVSSMEWIPLRPYEHWAKQLDKLSSE
jgi:muconolactone delta-isomerase